MNTTSPGTMKFSRRVRQAAMISCSVSAAPSSRTTNALIASPSTSSGTPIDGGLLDALDVEDRVLDLDRADLLAAGLDDVVAPPHEVEEPVLVHGEVILGAEHALAG